MKPEDMYYPATTTGIWDHCVFLGKYEQNGKKYDLGVYTSADGTASAVIVYGNHSWQHMSGPMGTSHDSPIFKETWKRWSARKTTKVGRVETMLSL